jgi:hypothetical protein
MAIYGSNIRIAGIEHVPGIAAGPKPRVIRVMSCTAVAIQD